MPSMYCQMHFLFYYNNNNNNKRKLICHHQTDSKWTILTQYVDLNFLCTITLLINTAYPQYNICIYNLLHNNLFNTFNIFGEEWHISGFRMTAIMMFVILLMSCHFTSIQIPRNIFYEFVKYSNPSQFHSQKLRNTARHTDFMHMTFNTVER